MASSRLLRFVFWIILLVMLAVAVFALLNQEAPVGSVSATQVELTVQAAVNARLTEVAAQSTSTPFPSIEETVQFRLTVSPTPVPPSPTPRGDVVGVVENVGGGIWSFIRSLWNLFAFGGIFLQLCCCLLIPGGVLLLLVNDTRPRRR